MPSFDREPISTIITADSDREGALKAHLTYYDRHQDELLKEGISCGSSAYNKTVWAVWDIFILEATEKRIIAASILSITRCCHGNTNFPLFS